MAHEYTGRRRLRNRRLKNVRPRGIVPVRTPARSQSRSREEYRNVRVTEPKKPAPTAALSRENLSP